MKITERREMLNEIAKVLGYSLMFDVDLEAMDEVLHIETGFFEIRYRRKGMVNGLVCARIDLPTALALPLARFGRWTQAENNSLFYAGKSAFNTLLLLSFLTENE